jgi:hypothetical protein
LRRAAFLAIMPPCCFHVKIVIKPINWQWLPLYGSQIDRGHGVGVILRTPVQHFAQVARRPTSFGIGKIIGRKSKLPARC